MSEETPRTRLRFDEVLHTTSPDGRCAIEVRLEWCGTPHSGRSEGIETHQGRLRTTALATLAAVASAADLRIDFDLVGVKAVRAFDGWVVVTSIRAAVADRAYRLLGSTACEREEDLGHSAAQSVLDATNRVLEQHVSC